jgi:hypothetical protein
MCRFAKRALDVRKLISTAAILAGSVSAANATSYGFYARLLCENQPNLFTDRQPAR